MKKIVKYFSIATVVFLLTILVVGIFYLKVIYQSLAGSNNLSPAVTAFFKRLGKQNEAPLLKPEYTIRILEGWTSRDIAQYFEENEKWPSDDFFKVAGFPQVDYRNNKKLPSIPDFSLNYSFLKDKPEYYGLEGYLFPDTYRVYASSTVTEVVEKMLSNFDQKLTLKMRDDIKSQGRSIYDVVTLASIVEKESPLNYQSGDNRDARIIAGIFLNRLRNGQALQSDATLSYIYNDNKSAHSGEELDADSPYNTYRYKGLPPGPICNPGILAIEAAIYPIKTDYNYFLTTDNGDVVYARTYDDHLKNKYKYLK